MIDELKSWIAGRTRREQLLLGIAAGLVAFALVVFGLILPGASAIQSAEKELDLVIDRRGRIEAVAALAKTMSGSAPAPVVAVSLESVISESAAADGFEIADGTAVGDFEYRFRLGSTKASALLGWLTALEAQGVELAQISLKRGEGGFVSAEVTARRKM